MRNLWAIISVLLLLGVAAFDAFAGSVQSVGSPRVPSYTIANLPTCNAANAGLQAYVTNATSPTYNAALTAGGAVVVPVFCNGSAWTSH
jgi:hypothetical protein